MLLTELISDYVSALRYGQNVSARTVVHYRRCVLCFIRWLQDEDGAS